MEILQEDIDWFVNEWKKLPTKRDYSKPTEYAEKVRYMPNELTPFPGKFSFQFVPYYKEILDCFHPFSNVRKVYVMKGVQIGATTSLLENIMLYGIGCNPSQMLYVVPDEAMAKTAMQTKIDRMIDNSGLRSRIFSQTQKARASRTTGDTALQKEFVGGYLHAVGSKSGTRFRNFSYKIIVVDELDAMEDEIKGEGDLISLILARSSAYSASRKIYFGSTPTVEQTSKILKLYNQGDKRHYFVPCKHCGKMQTLEWRVMNEAKTEQIGGIVFDLTSDFTPNLETVAYKCRFCGGLMRNYDKTLIMEKGEWRATATAAEPNARSYHLSPLYNPPGMFSWEDIVSEFAKCWDFRNDKLKDIKQYQTFRNLYQGLPFHDQGMEINVDNVLLHVRTGFARRTIPNVIAERLAGSPIRVVTCAVDVQKDRLYVDVKGFSDRGVTWTLDFFQLDGETERSGGVWDKLARFIESAEFLDENGRKYRIMITLVDSGHYSDYVYDFCRQYSSGVYAIKGAEKLMNNATFQPFSQSVLYRTNLSSAYLINTTILKDRIANSLKEVAWDEKNFQSNWFANFPEDFDKSYFQMFDSEYKTDEFNKKTGRWIRSVWKLKPFRANHAFDTYVYNLAAVEILAEQVCNYKFKTNLDMDLFWEYCGTGAFWIETKKI